MNKLASLALVFAVLGCGSPQEQPTTRTQQGATEPAPVEPAETPETADERTPEIVVGSDPCVTDADCVSDGCCHPTACVARVSAPVCTDVMCTSECRYGTLDCGGACLCQAGHCAARLSLPPVISMPGGS